jgi:hypothetical protein
MNIGCKYADIKCEGKEICIQGGITAYGYEEYFKVPSVIVVTATVDAKAKQKEQEERKRRKEGGTFGEVFKEACDELQKKDEVAYHTNGYTKDAKAFHNNIKMREYT